LQGLSAELRYKRCKLYRLYRFAMPTKNGAEIELRSCVRLFNTGFDFVNRFLQKKIFYKSYILHFL